MLTEETDLNKAFEGKTVLVTGGTGSFGNSVTTRLLNAGVGQIIILSRDEKKQFDMGNAFTDPRLKFKLGDVRDAETVGRAMRGVNLVFHAAALKQVPNCEFFPMEAIRTNAMGAHNVIQAAIEHKVERVVVLSTDKAVHPINVMGMTKALMERIMVAASREPHNGTMFCGTRYGNVMYTRGSVIPHFVALMKQGKPLPVTNPGMTRFMMPLAHSVDLVLFALANGGKGDIFVRKSPAATMQALAEAMVSLFDYQGGVEAIGIRPGEKVHEMLVSPEELPRTEDRGDYYSIAPEVPGGDFKKYYVEGITQGILPEEGYTSENTKRLTVEEMKALLLELPEIKEELEAMKK